MRVSLLMVTGAFLFGCASDNVVLSVPDSSGFSSAILAIDEPGGPPRIWVFDLHASEPSFAFRSADGTEFVWAAFEESVEELRLPPGITPVDKLLAGEELPGGTYYQSQLADGRFTEWTQTSALIGPIRNVRRPPDENTCVCIELETSVELPHYLEHTVPGAIDVDHVLIMGELGEFFEVNRDGTVQPIPELTEGPASKAMWTDDVGRFWTVDEALRVSRIERTATGYTWVDVIDATATSTSFPMAISGGRNDLGEIEFFVSTRDLQLHWINVVEQRWISAPMETYPDIEPWETRMAWVQPGRALTAVKLLKGRFADVADDTITFTAPRYDGVLEPNSQLLKAVAHRPGLPAVGVSDIEVFQNFFQVGFDGLVRTIGPYRVNTTIIDVAPTDNPMEVLYLTTSRTVGIATNANDAPRPIQLLGPTVVYPTIIGPTQAVALAVNHRSETPPILHFVRWPTVEIN